MRVATYNIRSLRDDAEAVTRVIRRLEADLICIQEAPRFLAWRRRCRWLATRCGLVVISGGRAAAANLLLARPSVTVHRTSEIKFTRDRGLSLRGAAFADVSVGPVRLVLIGTHLDGVDEPRLRHINELRRATRAFLATPVPYVIGVDVNAEPGSPSWARLQELGRDAAAVTSTGSTLTNQPRSPTRRIDALFVHGFDVLDTRAVDSEDVNDASDHRPVFATLILT